MHLCLYVWVSVSTSCASPATVFQLLPSVLLSINNSVCVCLYVCLTRHRCGHGPALNAGAERSWSFPGKSSHSDVIRSVRLQAADTHACLCCTVGLILYTVDVTVHNIIAHNFAISLHQWWRCPCQSCRGGAQSHHAEVLWVTTRCVLKGRNLKRKHLESEILYFQS